jgi:dephospho-CoA kinase
MGIFTKKKKRVLVLTAPISAGKTTVVKILHDHSFRQYRFAESIMLELVERGLDINDPQNFKSVGDEMRKMKGPEILAKKGIDALRGYTGKLVFDGARNPQEILQLRKEYGDELLVLSITSPFEDRYKRYSEKFEEGEMSIERFASLDNMELNSGDINGHHIEECIKLSDVTIANDSSIEEFRSKVEKLVKKHFKE